MDTMFLTRVTGALCGALLFFLMVHWGAEELYHVGGHDDHGKHAEGDYGDDHHGEKMASALGWIEIPEDGAVEEEEVIEVAFADVFATADAGAGERVWSKCRSCHKLEAGANGTGPYLFGVVGRQIASADGFNYSGTLSDLSGDAWTPENLNAFLESPRGWAPGTSMSFNGLPKVEDRANLIAYMATIGN
ncbi:MAG: cytochrome c family protein [Pseudomonadota bacterium]